VHAYPGQKIELLVYRAEYVSGTFELRDHEELTWAGLAELDQYTFAAADRPIIEKIKGALGKA